MSKPGGVSESDHISDSAIEPSLRRALKEQIHEPPRPSNIAPGSVKSFSDQPRMRKPEPQEAAPVVTAPAAVAPVQETASPTGVAPASSPAVPTAPAAPASSAAPAAPASSAAPAAPAAPPDATEAGAPPETQTNATLGEPAKTQPGPKKRGRPRKDAEATPKEPKAKSGGRKKKAQVELMGNNVLDTQAGPSTADHTPAQTDHAPSGRITRRND
jgi:hypothetical protein